MSDPTIIDGSPRADNAEMSRSGPNPRGGGSQLSRGGTSQRPRGGGGDGASRAIVRNNRGNGNVATGAVGAANDDLADLAVMAMSAPPATVPYAVYLVKKQERDQFLANFSRAESLEKELTARLRSLQAEHDDVVATLERTKKDLTRSREETVALRKKYDAERDAGSDFSDMFANILDGARKETARIVAKHPNTIIGQKRSVEEID